MESPLRGGLDDQRANRLWAAGLASLVLLVAFEGSLFLGLPYDFRPDQDLVLAYNALLLNSGLRQEFFDYGYPYIVLLAEWYRLLGALGLLPTSTLSAIPPVAEQAAFEFAWQQIVDAGRLLSIAIIAVYALALSLLVAKLFEDRRIGFLAGLAFATASGSISQIGILRTEPLSSLFTVAAILLVALVASGRVPARGSLSLGSAAFLSVVAVLTKVFAFIPLLVTPVVAFAFGPPGPRLRQQSSTRSASILVPLAILLAIGAAFVIAEWLPDLRRGASAYRPFGPGPLRYYQVLVPIWVLCGLTACAARWRIPAPAIASALAAMVIGATMGLAILLIRPEPQNLLVASHPLEHLFVYATWSNHSLAVEPTVLSDALLRRVAEAAITVVRMRFARPESDNVFLLEWAAALALLLTVRDRTWLLRIALLLLISLALQTAFLLRYDSKTYHVYSDPFTILAACYALARFRWVLDRRWGAAAISVLMTGYVVWGLTSAVKSSRAPRADPTEICDASDLYLTRLEPFPFCTK